MLRSNHLNRVPWVLRFAIAFLLTGCFSLHVEAKGKPTALQFAYELQGEYVGRIVDPNLPVRSGLQIVATSESTFDAYLLDGGLPGDGWDQQGKLTFKGEGYQRVTFSNSEFGLQLKYMNDYPGIIFAFHKGYRIGTLRKVHRQSPTLGLAPPNNGIVLFNGEENSRLKNVKINANGTLGIGAETIDQVQNVRLHVEFKTPFEPEKTGQGRGNSGVYIQRRYEVQILDSFGLELEPNRCGGLYRQKSADLNMAFPPGSWQTYDIYFYAAQFDAAGQRTKKARITVVQNGVRIHDNYELINKTGAGRKESPEPGPIWFQDHRDPVQFRNLWMVPLDDGEVLASDMNPAYGIFNVRDEFPKSELASTGSAQLGNSCVGDHVSIGASGHGCGSGCSSHRSTCGETCNQGRCSSGSCGGRKPFWEQDGYDPCQSITSFGDHCHRGGCSSGSCGGRKPFWEQDGYDPCQSITSFGDHCHRGGCSSGSCSSGSCGGRKPFWEQDGYNPCQPITSFRDHGHGCLDFQIYRSRSNAVHSVRH